MPMKKKLIPAKKNHFRWRFQDNARIVSVLLLMASVWMILVNWIYVPKEAVVFPRLNQVEVIHANARITPALTSIAVLKRKRFVLIIGGDDQSVDRANVTCLRDSMSHVPWTPESVAARPTITSKAGDVSLVTVTIMALYRPNATPRLEHANVSLE